MVGAAPEESMEVWVFFLALSPASDLTDLAGSFALRHSTMPLAVNPEFADRLPFAALVRLGTLQATAPAMQYTVDHSVRRILFLRQTADLREWATHSRVCRLPLSCRTR